MLSMVLFKFGWSVLFCSERQQNLRNLPAGGHALIKRREPGRGARKAIREKLERQESRKNSPLSARIPFSSQENEAIGLNSSCSALLSLSLPALVATETGTIWAWGVCGGVDNHRK